MESMSRSEDDECTSVRVALRIRPQLPRERIDMCRVCTSVVPDEPQVTIKDRCFTYDYVFDLASGQQEVYDKSVRSLIDGCFEGYNATVFAYGQTGSGKTYSMGTGFDVEQLPLDEVGIIPRAVEHLFKGITQRTQDALEQNLPVPDFKVNAQFMELYNEEIVDLGDPSRDPDAKRHKSHIKIHEDAGGGIYIVGVTTHAVHSLEETIKCLKVGALSRSTASTNMNVQSSRSHAIFTLHIKQSRLVSSRRDGAQDEKEVDSTQESAEFEVLTAKFHFVDLAGSERLKRTGATGERQKEGISINSGLLALGNVISALGDKTKKGSHVPYRDSKLTRLLQDSLGGNSRTLMIACVSPSDCDFVETLNTLKYANRARNIKNKVVANQDKASRQLAELRTQIMVLQSELNDFKSGKNMVDADGVEYVNDMFHENTMLQKQNDGLRARLKAVNEVVESLKTQNSRLTAERDLLRVAEGTGVISNDDIDKLVDGYLKDIQDLHVKLSESDATCLSLRRAAGRSPSRALHTPAMAVSLTTSMYDPPTSPSTDLSALLSEARRDVKKMKKRTRLMTTEENDETGDTEKLEEIDDENDEKTDEEPEIEEAGGDEGDEEADLDAESSDSLDEDDTNHMHEDLADLTCEMSIKQKLIDELEQSQRRLMSLRQQYEDKLSQLQLKIKEIESERDTVLSNLGQVESNSVDKSKKIKDQYEKKLNELLGEVKKLNTAKKEHVKTMKNQALHERQLKALQRDLSEMKNTKVRLMKQIKEEAEKTRMTESRRSREMSQMKKDQRLKDNTIRTLESDKRQKEIILRRKLDEVETLRKKNKPMSSKAAGRVGKYTKPVTVPVAPVQGTKRLVQTFSPKVAKHKWDTIEKSIACVIHKKQTIAHMEKDMENWLKEREKVNKKLERVIRRRKSTQSKESSKELDDIMDSMRQQIGYTQENIDECQMNIVQMEETKVEGEVDMGGVLSSVGLSEAKYLLEHFVDNAISRGLAYAQKNEETRELVAKIHQSELNNTLQQDLLRHMIGDQVNIEVEDLPGVLDPENEDEDSPLSSLPSSPIDSMIGISDTSTVSQKPQISEAQKLKNKLFPSVIEKFRSRKIQEELARRRTATTQELLYSVSSDGYSVPLLPLMESKDVPSPGNKDVIQLNHVSSSFPSSMHPPRVIPPKTNLPRYTGHKTETSHPKRLTEPSRLTPDVSPTLARNNSFNLHDRVQRSGTTDTQTSSESTPPASPQVFRRAGSMRAAGDNVFSRLSTSHQSSVPSTNKGVIDARSNPLSINIGQRDYCLSCQQVAVGHTKPVLGVDVTDEAMVTCSQDRTAKLWDLDTNKEIQSWTNHPNSVTGVRYNEDTNLVYTVSQSNVHVWDSRQDTQKCVILLNSSGLSYDAIPAPQSVSTIQEPPISDITLNRRTCQLYMAVGSTVRIWDLNKFMAIGKLTTGHLASVMVMAVEDSDSSCTVITGSKDHYIKVFKLNDGVSGSVLPKCTLEPPHYDGIQSLAIQGDVLYSGSRDNSIKKWDLDANRHMQSLNAAHKDWVTSLNILPDSDILVSSSRDGFIKIWNVSDSLPLGEVRAHPASVNALASNSMSVFTAASDNTVGIWSPTPKSDVEVIDL